MEEKMYYVQVGYCGPRCHTPGNRKYGCNAEFEVPVKCTEKDLDVVATAIGRGYLGDSVVVYDHEHASRYEKPLSVMWDCM